MNKIRVIISLLSLFVVLWIFPGSVLAADPTCSSLRINMSGTVENSYILNSSPTISFTLNGVSSSGYYVVSLDQGSGNYFAVFSSGTSSSALPVTFSMSNYDHRVGTNTLYLTGTGINTRCSITSFQLITGTGNQGYSCNYLYISQQRNGQECYGGNGGCIETGGGYKVRTQILKDGAVYSGGILIQKSEDAFGAQAQFVSNEHVASFANTGSSGTKTVQVKLDQPGGNNPIICIGSFQADISCGSTCLTTANDLAQSAIPPISGSNEPYKICEQIDRNQDHLATAYDNCINCVKLNINGQPGTEQNPGGLWTAIGCIPRDPTAIVQNLLRVGLGMGGGVALLMILAAGFLFSISQGDPKRTGEAKELLTAAISGLLFIIFSVVILQFIGYTVLQIPGFGG